MIPGAALTRGAVYDAAFLRRRHKFYTDGELRCMDARALMAIYIAKRPGQGDLWTGATWLREAIRHAQAVDETKRLGEKFIDQALAGS